MLLSTVFVNHVNHVFADLQNVLPGIAEDPRWLDNPAITKEMLPATLETLGATLLSSFFTVLLGLPLGLALVATQKAGLAPQILVNKALGLVVNVGRSIPFIILAVAIIPFTRLLAGTSYGWKATCVPLVVAAVPFFARLVESNIMSVDLGKIEAAKMMGATRTQIMWGVQVREAMPALVQSVTVLVVTLIGYSAITGAFGGGGLGRLAINYGYTQFQPDTMIVSVVVIAAIVIIFQAMGDMLSRWVDHR